jgi:hypothetical protein
MAIDELIAVVAAPPKPTEAGPLALLPKVENTLGIRLPKDIVDFGLRYGSGMFGDTIEVYNPFSASYLDAVNQVSDCYRSLKEAEGSEFIPYNIFPEKPGLLVCGSEVNGHILFWLTDGQPDNWPLILMTVDGQFERWDTSVTSFLARILRGKTGCVLWDKDWVKANLVGVAFRSK